MRAGHPELHSSDELTVSNLPANITLHDRPVSLSAIQRVYGHAPLTPELVQELNPILDFASVLDDAAEIDYPVARL